MSPAHVEAIKSIKTAVAGNEAACGIIRRECNEQRTRQEERAEKETPEDPDGKKGGEESQERERYVFGDNAKEVIISSSPTGPPGE